MNVPDVVHTLSAMIVFSAVLLVPIQLWFGPIPKSLEQRVQAQRARGRR